MKHSTSRTRITSGAAPSSRRWRYRWLTLAVAGLAVVAVFWTGRSGPKSPPPSIVFILVDTLRADYLGCYGFDGASSPNLDQLAAEAVLFENCFSQAPWTKPAIASLFTSLHPAVHGVLSHRGRYVDKTRRTSQVDLRTDALAKEAATLAETLRVGGYSTAAFVANPWISRHLGFAQGFDLFEEHFASNVTPADRVLDAARAWLRSRPAEKPFFLYLHFMDVHGPYDAPDDDYMAVRDIPGLGESRRLSEQEQRSVPDYMKRVPWLKQLDGNQLRTWRGRYAAGVHAFDRRISPFLQELRRSNILDQSIVVITSDHGEELCEHGSWDHGHHLYDHQIQIPLLVRYPNALGGGTRIKHCVSLIDLMPTLLAAAGVKAPPGLQGRDLSPLMQGKKKDSGLGVSFSSGVKWQPNVHALRTDRYKFIADIETNRGTLIDLVADPAEQGDAADPPPQVLQKIRKRFEQYLVEITTHAALRPETVRISKEFQEHLKSLGYLE